MIGAWIAKQKAPASLEALNRRDLDAWLKDWAEDATFIYPGDVRASGTYTGKEAIRAWFQRMFEQFPTIQFKVKHVAVSNLFDLTGNNVVTVNWEVHVVNRDGVEAYNRGVAVISIKKGKLVHLQEYIFDTGAQFCAAWGEGA